MGEMVALPLATAALHVAVSSVDGSIIQTILFSLGSTSTTAATAGNNLKPPENDNGIVTKTLRYLCHGIINTFIAYDGCWRAKLNTIAVHTLMDVIFNNSTHITLASTMLSGIQW